MFRRVWQSSMIALARSKRWKAAIQGARATSSLSRRYVAGDDPEAAIARATALFERSQIRSSLFFLGEYVETPKLVDQNVAAKLTVVTLLGQAGLDVHVSVDPTQIGYSLDPDRARRNAFLIAEAVAQGAAGRPGVHVLMLDMEDQGIVDGTIALHDALNAAKMPVALTLQAYLHRTEADLLVQIQRGNRVRLVKGAFAAGQAVAFTRRADIKANSRRLIDIMFSRAARDTGFYPIIATHDDTLHQYAIERAAEADWRADEYEFEMLLGVRADAAESLARRGERIRLYLPFGRDWWPYAMRRIGENPRNACLLMRSLIDSARRRRGAIIDPPSRMTQVRTRPRLATSANGMVRPCSCPASDRSWQGAPKTRSTPCLRILSRAIAVIGIDIGKNSFHASWRELPETARLRPSCPARESRRQRR